MYINCFRIYYLSLGQVKLSTRYAYLCRSVRCGKRIQRDMGPEKTIYKIDVHLLHNFTQLQ